MKAVFRLNERNEQGKVLGCSFFFFTLVSLSIELRRSVVFSFIFSSSLSLCVPTFFQKYREQYANRCFIYPLVYLIHEVAHSSWQKWIYRLLAVYTYIRRFICGTLALCGTCMVCTICFFFFFFFFRPQLQCVHMNRL